MPLQANVNLSPSQDKCNENPFKPSLLKLTSFQTCRVRNCQLSFPFKPRGKPYAGAKN
jgi:hypothetical protein